MIPGIITAAGATWTASGVNAPSSQSSGDGSIYWGITMKRSGSGIYYCVWKEAPTNVFNLVWNGPDGFHRAIMQQDNGKLVVTGYTSTGDNSPSERVIIPNFVPLPSGPAGTTGPQGIPGPQGPKGDPGSGGSGELDANDRKALDWIKDWLKTLLP